MTLKEFADKYNVDAQELFDILIFEKFPIATINDEVDTVICQYLIETTGIKQKKKSFKSTGNKNKYNKEIYKKKECEKDNDNNKKQQIIVESKKLGVLAQESNIPASAFINYFLKKGKFYSINQILLESEIIEFAKEYEISFVEKNTLKEQVDENHITKIKNKNESSITKITRPPIVVIAGHVDHGKTSLLDYIRKKSVAKSEKGGITQHVGAYTIKNKGKDIVFIDTPGHGAFTSLRERGVSIADIAILIIAADDGVMEQTKETIKMLTKMGTPIIVAITKIDKIKGEPQFEKIYQQLTEQGVVVDKWGGPVSTIAISSLTGEGIADLLDLINLTAEIIDIKTDNNKNPEGYILESKIEKGRGCVATIILHQGILKKGDWIGAETVLGKVSSIRNCKGEFVDNALPSYPYIVAGFDELPEAGMILKSDTQKNIKLYIEEKKLSKKQKIESKQSVNTNTCLFNVIIKADVYSSLQAIIKSINEIKNDSGYAVNIVTSSIGNILATDIEMASTTGSTIYGFGIKIEDSKTLDFSQEKGVEIKQFDVIYHLLEDIEKEMIKKKDPVYVYKKTGELLALKIFDIKNLGKIVGFRVVQGNVKNQSTVKVLRNNQEIGSGIIKTLQKDRESVKELAKGHEGAIMVEGFSNWQESDTIQVFIKTIE